MILGRNRRGSYGAVLSTDNGRRAPHVLSIAMGASLHHCQLISPARLFPLDTLNDALQIRMQCAGSTLAVRQAGNAGFL